MKKEDYHKFFDNVYNVMLDQNYMQPENAQVFSDEPVVDLEEQPLDELEEKADSMRYTISQKTTCYKIFKICKVLASCYLCLVYPFYAHFGIGPFNSVYFYLLAMLEGVLLIDFILNHFIQPLQEDGESMNLP